MDYTRIYTTLPICSNLRTSYNIKILTLDKEPYIFLSPANFKTGFKPSILKFEIVMFAIKGFIHSPCSKISLEIF